MTTNSKSQRKIHNLFADRVLVLIGRPNRKLDPWFSVDRIAHRGTVQVLVTCGPLFLSFRNRASRDCYRQHQ